MLSRQPISTSFWKKCGPATAASKNFRMKGLAKKTAGCYSWWQGLPWSNRLLAAWVNWWSSFCWTSSIHLKAVHVIWELPCKGPVLLTIAGFISIFSILVQDGASQKICYSIKGDSGSKFCLKCMNQTCIALPGQADEGHAICKAIKKSDLKLSTDQEVLDSWDRLARKYLTETSKNFKFWEQATGWTFSPHSLMHCKELRPMFKPISSYMHDWMHGLLSGGVANAVAYLVMEDLHKCGLTWQNMERYSKLWTVPANYKSCKVHEIFGKPDSHRKVQKIKASASDMLTLMPILRHYVLTCGQHADCTTSCNAFEAVCVVLDLLLSTLYGKGELTCNMLDSAVEQALSLCLLAGWGDYFTPKFPLDSPLWGFPQGAWNINSMLFNGEKA